MDIKAGTIFLEGNASEGKAIQLYFGINRQTPILVLGDIYKKHGQILDDILERFNIRHNKLHLKDNTFHARREGELYVAVGMSSYIQFREKSLALIGDSLGYSLKPDREHLEKLRPFTDINIEIM